MTMAEQISLRFTVQQQWAQRSDAATAYISLVLSIAEVWLPRRNIATSPC